MSVRLRPDPGRRLAVEEPGGAVTWAYRDAGPVQQQADAPGVEVQRSAWDVAIVGAGPAGSAAALGALQVWPQARVALLDRADFPRDKSCGDGVAPHVLDVLDELGAPGLLDDRVPVHRLRIGFPGGPDVARSMRRPALVVPRELLDARLVEAAVTRGATLVRHRVRVVDLGGLARRPVLDGAITAQVVIGADGAQSVVAPAVGGRRTAGVAIALRGYAPVSAGREHEQVIAFPRLPERGRAPAWPAYAWSFPLGDGRANVGYGELLPCGGSGPSRAQLLERLEALLPGAGHGGQAWRGHHLPLATARPHQPEGRVLLAGDALGLINPLTGEGIHAAVLSGAIAGRAAAAAARAGRAEVAGRLYRRQLRRRMGGHLRDIALAARLARSARVVRGGIAAAADDQSVFDDLVEFGLADGALTRRLAVHLLRGLV